MRSLFHRDSREPHHSSCCVHEGERLGAHVELLLKQVRGTVTVQLVIPTETLWKVKKATIGIYVNSTDIHWDCAL